MNLHTEPVRLIVLIAAIFATVGPALVAIGEGVDPLVAIGTAVAAFGALLGGEEFARSKAYAPATVDTIVDAEAVIRQAEDG